MSEVIERVARAICCASGNCVQEKAHKPCDWPMMQPEALAAIAAMREPTEAMKDAAGKAWGRDCAHDVWGLMIEAIPTRTPPNLGDRSREDLK